MKTKIIFSTQEQTKWNWSGFRPPLCTCRLNWARRTSWGWWDDWDDTALQTQNSKLEPWRSEAEHATSRSRRLPTILTFTRGWGRNIFSLFQTAESGNRTPKSGVKGSGANHYPKAPAPQEQTTEHKFNSMGELAKEFRAQYPQTLSSRKCLHTATPQAGILSIICESWE